MTFDTTVREIPIFPLPRAVLMPRGVLPLHVFEPRYRSLVQHCLAERAPFGVATLMPGYEANYQGSPAIWPEMGLGRVVAHHGFPDGRYDIVVRSVARCRLVEEVHSDNLFRVVRVEVLIDADLGAEVDYATLRALAAQLGATSEAASEHLHRLLDLPGPVLTDELAGRAIVDPDAQRAYLVTNSLAARRAAVEDRLARILAERSGSTAEA